MRSLGKLLFILVLFTTLALAESPAVRIKDIATISGVRSNQLIGVGLVVGLKGSGDSNNSFTNKALTNLLMNMGASAQKDFYKSKNIAAVMVTAELPPFAKPGQKIDVFVASIGDATSLKDGTLLMTPLKGADDNVYAVCQGPIVVASSPAGSKTITKKNEAVSKVIGGAIVEDSVKMEYVDKNSIFLMLNNPDFTTATRISGALEAGGYTGAKAVDPSTVEIPITMEDKENIVGFISQVEDFLVVPDSIARVVINQRTGTVVIGENVRLAPVAISHGDIEINIKAEAGVTDNALTTEALAAAPLSTEMGAGENGTGEEGGTGKAEQGRAIKLVQLKAGASLSSLVNALNSVGTSPQDLVAIIQALKVAGSLTAEVEVI